MASLDLYHGTNGDNILKIIQQRQLKPTNGKIFLSSAGFAGCLAMGADRKRGACFVLKLRCNIPSTLHVDRSKTTNVPGTVVLNTPNPIGVEVLELYVRPARATVVTTIKGAGAIAKYLTTKSQ